MSFLNTYKQLKDIDINEIFNRATFENINRALHKDQPTSKDFLLLLSPTAEKYLEDMAKRAHYLTKNFFGKTMMLYTPLYVSDYCANKCLYCGFKADNNFDRKTLTYKELEQEAKAISEMGIRHILILSGESRKHVPLNYLQNCVRLLKEYFSSISIEIYPLETEEYEELIKCGVDGLTIYQEVYNRDIYDTVHLQGPKTDYEFRLNAPERGLQAGMRRVNIGALQGLGPWRKETFITGMHAKYLLDNFPEAEVSISFPRLRPFAGQNNSLQYDEVSDKNLVQMIVASRIFLKSAGINISTRESSELRENLLPLGVTRMSAGVSTEVGGYSGVDEGKSQFEISDDRPVQKIKQVLLAHGYQPVLKDWEIF
ncbi:2-iminoacetate synthase ThiH [Natranaerobius trueperi]|uniref:2-iminoacetate synthase ThiH n=1 Tax=Natranaerobius trueperi TaxID=759412 RepID=A0A226BXI7_9FIRM|nr:2-iminoacetate synthase ThiH [Natranaerobius trueperi]OWZ82827.1 2-iminoacetate synthase ThiH [Natranaerobius trueperi]